MRISSCGGSIRHRQSGLAEDSFVPGWASVRQVSAMMREDGRISTIACRKLDVSCRKSVASW